jgi:hypothetical protein
MINIALLVLLMVLLAKSADVLRRMEIESRARHNQTARLEAEQERLERATDDYRGLVEKVEKDITSQGHELHKLREEREAADEELKRIQAMPKERLLVADRATVANPKLWELEVVNEQAARTGSIIHADAWAKGRICIIGGATERDARHRGESRFPSGLGYRIHRVSRFRRT